MCDACISVRRDYPNESVRLTPYQANSKCFHDTFSIFQDSSFFSKKQLPFLLTSEIFLLFLHFSEKNQCSRKSSLFNFLCRDNDGRTAFAAGPTFMPHMFSSVRRK